MTDDGLSMHKGPSQAETSLEARASSLANEVGALRLSVDQWARRTRRAERLSQRTAFAASIVVVLVLLVSVFGYQQIVTQDGLNRVTAQENQTRNDVLCPLYALILGSYNPNTRTAGAGRKAYEDAFATMRSGYSTLGCTAPIIPPKTSG